MNLCFYLYIQITQGKKPKRKCINLGRILVIRIAENGQSYSYFTCVVQIFMKEYNVC